jgi:TolB-like protein/AraC-like DNA-binding protein
MENQPSMGDQFLAKIFQLIEDNLENEHFSVEDLAHHAGLSRSMLHRKLIKLTGKSASYLITERRLIKAKELLENDVATTAEIAYKVGFNSPSYFNKVFKKHFHISPGDVRKNAFIITHPATSDQTQEIRDSDHRIISRRNSILIIVLLAGAIAGAGIYYAFRKSKPVEKSILILPFDNLSNEDENQYFADGITEDILNNLFLISDLRVLSRTTSKHFSETNLSAREIARDVNARNVLEGSVRRYGNKVRISVQLIDAYQDQHLWSANFDRELNDIIGIQGDIALQVAERLNAVISDKEKRQIGKKPTQNAEAYDNYLKGRFLLNKANDEQRVDISREGLMGSMQYFEKAIVIDPNFAEAYAGLSSAWINVSAWGWYQPYYEGIRKAKEFSMKALQIDPGCSEAHAVKGGYLIWPERRWEEGRKELLISLQLNPNYAFANQAYAQLLMITGPIEEARIYMDRAIRLEPYFWVLYNLNAWIYYFEGRHKEAVEACRIARDLKSNYLFNDWLFFINYAKLGEGEKAAMELQTIAHRYTGTSHYADEIKNAYNRSGIPGLFTWLTEVNINNPLPGPGMNGQPFFVAWWYAILGKKEETLYWLERNMESEMRNYTYFNLIATNPDFDILRNDPRFLAIVNEIGLAPYNTRKAK